MVAKRSLINGIPLKKMQLENGSVLTVLEIQVSPIVSPKIANEKNLRGKENNKFRLCKTFYFYLICCCLRAKDMATIILLKIWLKIIR